MSSGAPRPTQAPTADNGSQVLFPTYFAVDVVIDGLTYHLPSPEQPHVDIMLLDGSFGRLLPGSIMLRGQTFDIPSDLTSPQPVSVGGQSIQAQPGQSTKPESHDDDHNPGGGGLFAFLGGLGGAAGSAATAMSNAAASAVGFGSAGAGAGASLLAKSLGGATSSASGVISSLNGIQQSFPTKSLSEAGLNTFLQAQNLGRSSINSLESMGKMLEGFDNLKPDVQQQVRANIAEISGPGGLLQQASAAMDALSDFPWEEEAPKTDLPSPTAGLRASESAGGTRSAATLSSKAGTSASTRISSTSAISSSATPTATSSPQSYFISTRKGTPVDEFINFVQDLDNGVGKKLLSSFGHVYTTNLNATQAEGLYAKYPFVTFVHTPGIATTDEADVGDREMFCAVSTRIQSRTRSIKPGLSLRIEEEMRDMTIVSEIYPRALLPEDAGAPYWKKMIASPFRQPLAAYSQ
jgi:hypothetical protein